MSQNKSIAAYKRLRKDLEMLEPKLYKSIIRWSNGLSSCEWARGYQSEGILKNLCQQPGTLKTTIFKPLYNYIDIYIKMLEGKLAYSGKKLDTFFQYGLTAIKRFAVVVENFMELSSNLVAAKSNKMEQKDQERIEKLELIDINERLIGCRDQMVYTFLSLLDTVKDLSPEMVKRKKYLEFECKRMRIEKLKT